MKAADTDIARIVPRSKLIEEQTSIRLKLLANGYKPLPAKEKMVTMKGWPHVEATEEEIQNWAISHAFATTAIRIEGDLVAVDVDVDDPRCDDLCDALEDAVPALREAPLRWGKGDKRMYLLRCPEQPKIVSSYVFNRDGDEDDRHRLETFGGGTTRYFTCYGPHTEGETTAEGVEIAIEYAWDEAVDDPTTTPASSLPAITVLDLVRLTDIANEFMERWGWKRSMRSATGKMSDEPIYDLSDDMVFECIDGVNRSLEELQEYAKGRGTKRCSASWCEPGASNRSRCVVDLHHDGTPKVFDFDTYTWHHPDNADRRTKGEKDREATTETASALGAALSLAGYDMSEYPGAYLDGPAEEQLSYLMDNVVFVEGDDRFHYIDNPDMGVRKTALLQTYNLQVPYEKIDGRSGAVKEATTTTGKIFCNQSGMSKVNRIGFDPREGLFFGAATGRTAQTLNVYRGLPCMPPATEKNVALTRKYLDHLMPAAQEQKFFLDWLRAKVERPWVRNCAVLFLAPGVSGTGRGTLFSIINAAFGEYAIKLKEEQLFEKHNGWADRKLIALADEVGGGTRYADRQDDYQKLKDLVDPLNTTMSVRRMREDSASAEVFVSFILATNRINGIRFDPEDRRFAVLTNGMMLEKVNDLWADQFMLVARTPGGYLELASALVEIASEGEVTYGDRALVTPPKFPGWYRMVEANKTDLDMALDEIAEQYQGKLMAWTIKDFQTAVRLKMSGGMSGAARKGDGVAGAVAALAEKERAEAVGLANIGQTKIRDRVTNMRLVTNDPEKFMALSLEDRGRVLDGVSSRAGKGAE